MLSPNAVSLRGVVLFRPRSANPLTGPVEATQPASTVSLEFHAPVGSWDWEEGQAGYFVNDVQDLFLHCQQDQNGQTWFAFRSREERAMASKITEAQGVGMKMALKILGGTAWTRIQELIDTGDRESLKKLPGVGPKTGDKLAVVLFVKAPEQPVRVKDAPAPPINEDAVCGLMALGYKSAVSKETITQAMANNPAMEKTSDILKAGLKLLAK